MSSVFFPCIPCVPWLFSFSGLCPLMLFGFTNADHLERALADGAVPPFVRRAPAQFHRDEDGRIFLRSSVRLSPATVLRLRRFGVAIDPLRVPRLGDSI